MLAQFGHGLVPRLHDTADLVLGDECTVDQFAFPVPGPGGPVSFEHQPQRPVYITGHDHELQQQNSDDVQGPEDDEKHRPCPFDDFVVDRGRQHQPAVEP
jgi:hypothetical protein